MPATALREFLAARRTRQIDFLAALVRQPSDNPPGDCAPHARVAAALLEELGFAVERHLVPADEVRAAGLVSITNLIVRHRFGPGPVIALNAHGDAVPPGAGWTRDPYGAGIADGWMYGRGAAVSKSDFATYAFALLALREAAPPPGGSIELHFTYDEESGGILGPPWLLARGLCAPDYAISAGFSYAVVTAHNGVLHLEVEARGRSAHAAKPASGVDALAAATAILSALYRSRDALAERISVTPGIGSPQLTVGLIAGGINTNVVPDRVTFRLDRRIIPEEDPGSVEAELRALIEREVRSVAGAAVEIRRLLLAEPLRPLPSADRLASILARHATEIMAEPIGSAGLPLYTDARHYAARGIPTVLYGAGPRTIEDANAHRADERVPLADLARATEILALGLADLLNPDGFLA
ncbi:MAG: M20/M25/M40 family metallo-hydrolase [Rhodospirillales bacterium]|nr:M20/M25/M40 family metallo-hydrolase [Rhodospirillales bacterium]